MVPDKGIHFRIQKYRFLQTWYFFVKMYHVVREFFLDNREHSAKESM